MANGGHYGGIEYSIHTDPVVRALHPYIRGTFMQLFSLPENTALPGLILAGRLGLAESLGLDLDIFNAHFTVLQQAGLVHVDWAARVCYVPAKAKMLCNAASSIWAAKHWRKVVNSAPSCPLVEQAERDARALLMTRLRANRSDGRGKAILASFIHGEAVPSVQADIVLNTLASPAQQPLPFAWEPPPHVGERPCIHALPEVDIQMAATQQPIPPAPQETMLPTEPSSSDAEVRSPSVSDDDPVVAFQEVVQAAGGPSVLGMARAYADPTGLPGHASVTWCQLWTRLRKERPDTTLHSARLLGEYGRGGGWKGLRCPWQALVKSMAHLAAMLDEAEDWHRRGRPHLGKGAPQPEVCREDDIIGQALRHSRRGMG